MHGLEILLWMGAGGILVVIAAALYALYATDWSK